MLLRLESSTALTNIVQKKPAAINVDRRASFQRQVTSEELVFFETLKTSALSMVQTLSLRQKKQSMTAAVCGCTKSTCAALCYAHLWLSACLSAYRSAR
jgi:hypothetical protein